MDSLRSATVPPESDSDSDSDGMVTSTPTQSDVQIPIVTKKKPGACEKVSEFPVPPRPPRTGKRGAEQNKLLFIKKMDKVYFSILALKNIREVLEPVEKIEKKKIEKLCKKTEEEKKKIESGIDFNVDLKLNLNFKKKLLTGTVPKKKNVDFKNFVLKRHTLKRNLELEIKIKNPVVEKVKPQEEICRKPTTKDLFTRKVTKELSTRLPVEIRKNLESLEKEK